LQLCFLRVEPGQLLSELSVVSLDVAICRLSVKLDLTESLLCCDLLLMLLTRDSRPLSWEAR
jgi:hypothetical protein